MWRHEEGNGNNKIQGKNAKIHHHHHPYQGQGQGQGQGHLRSWMVVNREGSSQTVEVGKHAIMRRSGLPARDLRMLEPALSHPSTILGRERAIVFNVEHIKAIITAHELLLLNSPHPAVAPFARQLLYRLFASPSSPSQPSSIFKEGGARNTRSNTKESHSKNSESPGRPFLRDDQHTNLTDTGSRSSKVLPFEFRALEVFLEEACNCLERETSTLEKEAYPALDELTITVSTLNLERVRQIKSRLVAISGRIQKVRDELEHLLDDEGDMAEMYLTNKMLQQQLEERSLDHRELPNESKPADVLHNDSASGAGSRSQRSEVDEDHASKHFDVAELEMLLEAYFVQTDGTLNKLSTLRQYVDNTEDYINIMLDDKQNQLLQMGVMLSTVNLLLNVCIVTVGIMGMNIHIKLFETGLRQFIATASGVVVGFFTLYGCAIAWYKKKHLIE